MFASCSVLMSRLSGTSLNFWKYLYILTYIHCRWGKESSWETSHIGADFAWKRIAEPVMRSYTEATDGSYIESKESALVWQYHDADPAFGQWQAIELLDHLESVLANEPVVVIKGKHIVEVKPQVYTPFSLILVALIWLSVTLCTLNIICFKVPMHVMSETE